VSTAEIAEWVLLLVLAIVATVLVPAAVIGWWRDRQAEEQAKRERHEYFIQPVRAGTPVIPKKEPNR
jgi:hypothetical protein